VSGMEHRQRLQKLRERLAADGFDGLLVTGAENRFYLSGFTGSAATLLVTMEEAFLFTDFRYVEQAAQEASAFTIERIGQSVAETVAGKAKALGIKRLGFEPHQLTYKQYLDYQTQFDFLDFTPAKDLVEDIRLVKDADELGLIKQAVRIADAAFAHILKYLKPGVREDEIAFELEYFMRREGASGCAFDFIVASGWRSAMPHGVASAKPLAAGELVTIDMGAVYKHYCSDITRTVVLGEGPDLPKQQQVYEIVLAAQLAGIKAARPGCYGTEVDKAARDVINAAGYGDYFGHSLGHGVGLAIHEGPCFAPRDTTYLTPGMVVTVEPGIYLPGWGGVRIEDMVVLVENGCEVLTNAPKELIII